MDGILRPRVAAIWLLRWLEEQDGPCSAAATPVDRLRELLGLQVARFHPGSRREGTYGWLEPGENLIFLRQDLSDPVRRFTLAHEIGHAILHRASGVERLPRLFALPSQDLLMPETTTGCEDLDLDAPLVVLPPGEEILRPGEAYSARVQRESEANAFAAYLLLPEDRLLTRYLARAQQQGAFSKSKRVAITKGLAREFGVSEDVVLRSLAAVLQSGIVPKPELTAGSTGPTGDMPYRVQLDQSQRQASTTDAPALIVAGPGTGKTSTLVGRVAYLVEERGTPADAILALTFSNKAAREMRQRLAALLQPPEMLSNGFLMPTVMPTVSTIHAFCGDLMRRYGHFVGLRPDFRLISETEGFFLLRQVASELMLHHYQPLAAPDLHFPALLAAISRAKDELAGPERYTAVVTSMIGRASSAEERIVAERANEVASVYAAYQDILRTRGDADFGDLIRLTVQLLRQQPEVLAEVQTRFREVLVDEFQDINRAMGVLLRILAGEVLSLWAVGDADQAIYRFRGASPANLSQFTSDYPSAQIQRLGRNYRSMPDILVAAAGVAGAILEGERTPLEAARWATGAISGFTVTLATAPDEQSELAGLVENIKRRAQTGRSLSEQVVLCRTRRQCQRVASALTAADIPTRMATSLLEQDEAKDILAVLSLPGDLSGSGLLRAGNIPDHAFSKQEAKSILAAARVAKQTPLVILLQRLDTVMSVSPSGRRGLAALAQIVAELQQLPDILTAVSRYIFGYTRIGQRLLREMMQASEIGAQMPRGSDNGAEITRIAQLLGLARAFEDQQRSQRIRASVTPTIPGQSKHADWAAFLEYVRVLLVLRQETANLEDGPGNDVDSVRILTVHASKGLEFPIVYLPGLADRRFPMQRRGNSVPLLPGLSEDEMLEAQDPHAHLAEEGCLFYVALTRARDEVVLSRAERYGRMQYRASPFLAPIRDALGERLRKEQWSATLPLPDVQSLASHPTLRERTEPFFTSAHSLAPVRGPVRHSEVEMYKRCPRQYAYRYVYELQPREIGLATLRHALHATLHKLQQRFAKPGRGAAGGKTVRVSLHEALNLFENEWARKLEQERRIQSGTDEGVAENQVAAPAKVSGDAFLELYRRHGRQVIERAWTGMAEHRLSRLALETSGQVFDAGETRFDEHVTVRVGEHQLSVILDRVEHGASIGDSASGSPEIGNGSTGRRGKSLQENNPVPAVPVRLVRHHLGNNGLGKPDLHALFYALAAQQSGESATELYSHNLTTGELDRVILDARKIAKLREELDTVLEGIDSGVYPPHPDPNICQSCPFLLICPA